MSAGRSDEIILNERSSSPTADVVVATGGAMRHALGRASITKSHEMSTKDFMDALPDEMAKHFVDKVDANHDGIVTVHEIAQLFASFEEKEHEVGVMRVELVIALFFLLVSIFANFGTAWAAYDLAQDTETGSNGVMTTRDGEVVKVASTLMEKKPTTNNGREVTMLTDRDTGKALATAKIAKALPSSKLSSEFDDETFDELDALKITNAKGTINFKVLGWARYVNEDSRCGTVVVLYTNPGSIQLDGVDMSFNEGVAGAFSRAGFQVTSRRRGRRAEDPDGQGLLSVAEVVGKFRYLSDKNLDMSQLTCGDDRPTVNGFFNAGEDGKAPADIAYTQTVLQRCDSGYRKHGCPAASLTVEFMGKSYYRRRMHTRAKWNDRLNRYLSISRMEFPEIPGGNALIIVSDGERSSKYSVGPSYPTPQYCSEMEDFKEGADISDAEFPADGGVEDVIGRDEVGGEADDLHTDLDDSAPRVDDNNDFLRTDKAFTKTSEGSDSVVVRFLGYNVLNDVYVRHFSLTTTNADNDVSTVDYYEHFEERRMYAVPLAPDSSINTFETITQAPLADVLQDQDYYPSFDAPDTFLLQPCPEDRDNVTNLFVDGYTPRTDLKSYIGELYVKEHDDATIAQEVADEAEDRVVYGTVYPNVTAAPPNPIPDEPVQGGGARKRRGLAMDSDGNICAGAHLCLIEDPGGDECVMNYMRHQCLLYSKSLIGGKCKFSAMLCAPFRENAWWSPAVYGSLKFECSNKWNIGGGATMELGGYLMIGLAVHNPNSRIRVGSARGISGNYFRPLGWSPQDNPCRGQPELYLEGSVWIEFKFSIAGLSCNIKGQIKVRFDFWSKDISHVFELTGGCGSLQFSIEVGLKWKPPAYPKVPHEASLAVGGYLVIDECARICHPMGSCGWRGCRSWTKCHRACIKVKIGGKLGPWDLK